MKLLALLFYKGRVGHNGIHSKFGITDTCRVVNVENWFASYELEVEYL